MNEKLLAALIAKYKNFGFSPEAIATVTAYLATSITEESQIETAIGGVEPLLKGFQSEIDKRVTTAVNKAKEPKEEPAKPVDTPPVIPPADTPEWAKGLIEANKTMLAEINNLKAGKTTETRKQQLETALAGSNDAFKNTTLKAFGRMQFATDEEFSTYLDEVKTDSETFTQGLADTSLSQNGTPRQPAGGTTAKPTQTQIDATLDAIMPK